MNKYLRILILAFGVYCLYSVVSLFIRAGNSFSKTKFTEEPLYYKEILRSNDSLLRYKYTLSKDSISPVSIYIYDSKYEIIVFRRKKTFKDLLDNVYLHKEGKGKSSHKVYTSFLSLDKFSYSYGNQEPIEKIDFFIEDYREDYIKQKIKQKLYLSFPLNMSFAMTYNGSNSMDVISTRNDLGKIEYNELMILSKSDFIYFIYLKPFYENDKENLMLERVVSE